MRTEQKVSIGIVSAAVIIMLALSGCATTPQYGDGKIGGVSIDPAVQSLATALNAKAPGTGDYVAKWFATSGVDRVPPGYAIQWESYLEGRRINRDDIIDVPRLVVKDGVAVPIPPPTDAPPALEKPDAPVDDGEETPEDIMEDLGT